VPVVTDRRADVSHVKTFRYRDAVLEQLIKHGIRPLARTPPALVREHLNDLYRYEIRRIRASLLRGDFVKNEYAERIRQLRDRYPLLSLPLRYWTLP
jgi:hypothetical protein